MSDEDYLRAVLNNDDPSGEAHDAAWRALRVIRDRAERAEAQVQRVRDVCAKDAFVANYDGQEPLVVEVEDIIRALDGGS